LTVGQFVEVGVRMNFQPLRTSPTWETKGLRFWNVQGFPASGTSRGPTWPVRVQVLAISYGWLAAAALVYPALRLGRWATRAATTRRRRRRNQCPHCSYDLTANVTGVCPECGGMRWEKQTAEKQRG
jgi:ribosomal protein L32